MKNKKIKNQKSSGVTIIELIVVLAIFLIIMSATVSIFLSIIQHQKRILIDQESLNQISYATEYISRSIRDSVVDETGSCIESSGNIYLLTHYNSLDGFYEGIKFISKDNTCQEFFLDIDGILKEVKDSQPWQNIISSKFNIKYVRFILNGDKTLSSASENNTIQPRVTMVLNIEIQTDSGLQEKIIQTTISNRNLNI